MATTPLQEVISRYEEPGFRALVQLIPYVGGPLDTVLMAEVSMINAERAKTFFDELRSGVRTLDETTFPELQTLARLAMLEHAVPRAWYNGPERENDYQHAADLWPTFVGGFGDVPEDAIRARLTRLARTGLYEPIVGSYYGYQGGMGHTTSLYARLAQLIGPATRANVDPVAGDLTIELSQFDKTVTGTNADGGGHFASWSAKGVLWIADVPGAGRVPSASVVFEIVDRDGQVLNQVRHRVQVAPRRHSPIDIQFSDHVQDPGCRGRVRIEAIAVTG